jgi:uncharacterized phage protein gp47/JayE
VNADTVNLIERPYQEIVDDLLTAIVGGVVNEPIVFDEKSFLYSLAQPAQDVRGITGTIPAPDKPGGIHYTFLKEVDFLFNPDKNAVLWQDGGQKPLDETKFYVDYFRPNGASSLTDINVGSVTRTLSEAIGREIATVYQQINLAYRSGFIDTAEGKALEFVVSILNVRRKTKEFAVGLVTFFRAAPVEGALNDGNISIEQGTKLSTEKGEVIFETTEPRTLQRGQVRIDVPIRAGDKFKGELGRVEAGTITKTVQAIEGVDRVSNFEPTFLAAEDESDAELRLRAKAALRAISKATILALTGAVFENRGKLEELLDPNTADGKQTDPGTVKMLVEVEPAKFPSLQAAVHETRAAGVQVTITARFVFLKLKIVAQITRDITGVGKAKIANQIIAALQKYIDGLSAGAPAEGEELLKAIKSVKDVTDAKIVDVRTSKADVGKPGADPLVEALVAELANVNSTDTDALRSTIANVLKDEGPTLLPSGRREPDRDLIQGSDPSALKAGGNRATDGEIETAKFKIVPPEKFSLILDMEPADIVLQET